MSSRAAKLRVSKALAGALAAPAPLEVPGTARAEPPCLTEPAVVDNGPQVVVETASYQGERDSRPSRLTEVMGARRLRQELEQEFKRYEKSAPERMPLQKGIEHATFEENRLQQELAKDFVPQHGSMQLISPQQLLMSRLFNVRSRTAPREAQMSFVLGSGPTGTVQYEGPELRQSDGLVFMALVNRARDFRAGTLVSFEPSDFCHWLYGYYDGASRTRLREAIYRLQHALLKFPAFSVQLAMRFSYPPRGRWSLMLDPDVVSLFQQSRLVWMDLETRKALPEGLTTWLYAYVESQTRLIPQPTEHLREMCGSDAQDNRKFNVMLSRALKALVQAGCLDEGWSIKQGVLRWRKPLQVEAG